MIPCYKSVNCLGLSHRGLTVFCNNATFHNLYWERLFKTYFFCFLQLKKAVIKCIFCFKTFRDHLGENLDLLLKAVLSKLQGSETLSVMQVIHPPPHVKFMIQPILVRTYHKHKIWWLMPTQSRSWALTQNILDRIQGVCSILCAKLSASAKDRIHPPTLIGQNPRSALSSTNLFWSLVMVV